MSPPHIQIFTDGSCSPNPGPGGWAAVILFEDGKRVVELVGAEDESTNNRMELLAALKALESLDDNCQIELFTDSKYLQKGITQWLDAWKRNGWQTQDRQSVKNQDLWQSFSCELLRHTIQWQWIKGHADNVWNNRADELAASARKKKDLYISNPEAVRLYIGVTWRHTTGRGSWATLLSYKNHVRIIGDSANQTTANMLYLIAAIEGLKSLKRTLPVEIYSKSGYFCDGMEKWLEGWKNRGWRTRDDKEVSNKKQWQEISILQKQFPLSVVSVSGDNPPCEIQEVKELAREFEAGDKLLA